MSNGPVLTLPGGAFMLSYALTQQGTNVLTCITCFLVIFAEICGLSLGSIKHNRMWGYRKIIGAVVV